DLPLVGIEACSPTEAIILRKPPRRLDLNGLLMEGPRAFCGDLRLFVEVRAKSRRSPANPAIALLRNLILPLGLPSG
ncbi:MAG: hypothetical protein JWO48_2381, partial [Bryobacterales bacterium]|nr:hypothetical protein [Bryobacterales bacterium]